MNELEKFIIESESLLSNYSTKFDIDMIEYVQEINNIDTATILESVDSEKLLEVYSEAVAIFKNKAYIDIQNIVNRVHKTLDKTKNLLNSKTPKETKTVKLNNNPKDLAHTNSKWINAVKKFISGNKKELSNLTKEDSSSKYNKDTTVSVKANQSIDKFVPFDPVLNDGSELTINIQSSIKDILSKSTPEEIDIFKKGLTNIGKMSNDMLKCTNEIVS